MRQGIVSHTNLAACNTASSRSPSLRGKRARHPTVQTLPQQLRLRGGRRCCPWIPWQPRCRLQINLWRRLSPWTEWRQHQREAADRFPHRRRQYGCPRYEYIPLPSRHAPHAMPFPLHCLHLLTDSIHPPCPYLITTWVLSHHARNLCPCTTNFSSPADEAMLHCRRHQRRQIMARRRIQRVWSRRHQAWGNRSNRRTQIRGRRLGRSLPCPCNPLAPTGRSPGRRSQSLARRTPGWTWSHRGEARNAPQVGSMFPHTLEPLLPLAVAATTVVIGMRCPPTPSATTCERASHAAYLLTARHFVCPPGGRDRRYTDDKY